MYVGYFKLVSNFNFNRPSTKLKQSGSRVCALNHQGSEQDARQLKARFVITHNRIQSEKYIYM